MTRPNGVFKTENEYQKTIDRALYEDTPKAVFAALLVSYLQRMGIEFSEVDKAIAQEWQALYEAEIVPQKPKVCPTLLAQDVGDSPDSVGK